MTPIKNILRALLLAFQLFIPQPQNKNLSFPTDIVREFKRKKKREERRIRIQKKRPKIRERKTRNQNYLSSTPKAHRFSNQRSLRRMYRNS